MTRIYSIRYLQKLTKIDPLSSNEKQGLFATALNSIDELCLPYWKSWGHGLECG